VQDLAQISSSISDSRGEKCEIKNFSSVSGGCINQAFCLKDQNGDSFFLKKNSKDFFPFFKAEAEALCEIDKTNTVRVPKMICFGESDISSFLVLEFIKEGNSGKDGQRKLGEQLAQLHLIKMPHFGWTTDNCIGATPQPNPESADWISFYRDYRLLHQFDLARKKGYTFNAEKELLENIDFFFQDYCPHPSLLHGDLWGGNSGYTQKSEPFIFDPASYYGDREADIAFTYMFGGYDSSFYKGYENIFPLDSGFNSRKTLYNLYHELNHLNLFGRGYESSSQSSIHQLVNQIH
tara:strand:+ start:3362 stop:4240 length:879 start_codon:yes stop_codon:yes gene_type:complete